MASTPPDPSGDLLLGQTIAAHDAGLGMEPYFAARAAGASHPEVLEATSPPNSLLPSSYAAARVAGATHAQILASHAARVATSAYAELRAAGVTHSHALEAYTLGYCNSYIEAHAAGLTHAELVEACAAEYTVTGYATLRAAALTHAELIHATTLPLPARRLYMEDRHPSRRPQP